MEFSLVVDKIGDEYPNLVTLKGEVDVAIELPLKHLGVSLKEGDHITLLVSREKDPEYKKFKIYMWGVVYHVENGLTRISIGGLQCDIYKELPFKVGDKVYIGIL